MLRAFFAYGWDISESVFHGPFDLAADAWSWLKDECELDKHAVIGPVPISFNPADTNRFTALNLRPSELEVLYKDIKMNAEDEDDLTKLTEIRDAYRALTGSEIA